MRAWLARLERLCMSPSAHERLWRHMADVDVRDDLPGLTVPTLVMHRTGDAFMDIRHSRYLAEQIPGARYVELPGEDSLLSTGDTESIIGAIEEFLTGGRRRASAQRRLLTVLFTDIVDSTARAANVGDARWRDQLRAHDTAAAARDRPLRRARGQDDRRLVPRDVRRALARVALRAGDGERGRAAGAADPLRAAHRRVRDHGRRRRRDGRPHRLARRGARAAGRGAGLRHGVRIGRRIGPAVRLARDPGAQGRARSVAALHACSA